ncbi:hypothetical protein PPYR_05229 [Photinus pyralis]|uniref:Gamma-interferon-inducible lysosomal thiol reductase n=1 Tax=Photinus pyralis TaxID=7054 RepID=A0A1Y1KGQ3_PHOPY|nr:gamma-interferon-inducible lysosomal thiol reductase-like [Photinus pyralis]XP_031340586.1 gamma-interferon-inducible lysosomal thiol reductase-like [Photinus pyralis]XP_031355527.1 gamma-interferon-inducible lysosomal thiol reductase-like [Photinus pyralis]KAB0799211.1 hypothetical protein PPYR_07091 [Photinus pyralis]KAB0800875.1 hypothetical protein PPYR_05229 [Photinus pyralis]
MNLLFSVIFLTGVFQVSSEKLQVSIYYEALCSDSVQFITKQLQPAYKLIGSNLEVDLVPYGKASQTQENGKWFFRCQHGPPECHGNILQACGLATDKSQAQKVDFVYCVMNQWDPSSDDAIEKCSGKLGLTSDAIFQCANSGEGEILLAKNGVQTHAVTPKITFIPTIVFNGVYSSANQNGAFSNFLKTACDQFHDKPKGCNA